MTFWFLFSDMFDLLKWSEPGSSKRPQWCPSERQPDKVKIFFVEDFVAEPDMALRGPLGVAFLGRTNQGKPPIFGGFNQHTSGIRGYNGITPPISLGYVNRPRWISTIFFQGSLFRLFESPYSFIWWSVWNLEHVSNFPPLSSVRFGGQKYVPKLGPPKTNSKKWTDILWHGRCPSLPFSNTPKKTVYIYIYIKVI